MKVIAVVEYAPDAEKIKRLAPAHHNYVKGLLDSGILWAAGPLADNQGATYVFEVETPATAEDLLKGDPHHSEGISVRWQLYPLKYWSAQQCKGA